MPLPGNGLTTWFVRNATAGKLRLHPTADEDTLAKIQPCLPFAGKGKKILLALAIGLGVGILVKSHFVADRFYRAEGRIAIHGITDSNREPIFEKHLFSLQTGDLSIAPDDPKVPISLKDLIAQGKISIFPSDSETISLLVTDTDRRTARLLASQFAQAYASRIIAEQNAGGQKLNEEQARLLAQYRELQQNHEKLKAKIDQLTAALPAETMDVYLGHMAKTLDERLSASNSLLQKMNRINADILRYRGEIVHPTITLDNERLSKMKGADRRYNGDYNLMRGKHTLYLASLKPEIKGVTDSMQTLRDHLQSMGRAISKQLELKLPSDLSDDLLEMSLAVEKYDGQLARFQERWTRYSDKLLSMLADPETADFDGSQTLLSQLRQDFMQRCATLPTHLEGLSQQLRQGQTQNGKAGKLSSLTARNVAASAIIGDLDQSLENWRALNFHLNRLFPDGNVNLLTLGRLCRSLQWRLNLRGSQLRQELEEQQIVSQKREAQVRLNTLQKDFEQTSRALMAAFQTFKTDEQKIADVSRRWPEAQKTQESLARIESEMASLEPKLTPAGAPLPLETVEALPVIVQGYTHAGFDTHNENFWSVLLALIGAFLAAVALMPKDFWRFWNEILYPRLKNLRTKN